MRRHPLIAAILAASLAGLGLAVVWSGPGRISARTEGLDTALAQASSDAERGLLLFATGDWGGLSSDTLRTSGQPWKLVNAALALDASSGDVALAANVDLAALYRGWGFLSPRHVGNWPDGLAPLQTATPLGLNAGLASRAVPPIAVTVANIGCAACHSSVAWDADGTPDPTEAWLGAPNTSINLEAWTQALFAALRDRTGDPDALMETLIALYPDTSMRERLTLRYLILPAMRDEVLARDDAQGALLPYRASMAGATNGFDSLRSRLGLIPHGAAVAESVFNAVPDLGSRLWRREFLNNGGYRPAEPEGSGPTTAADITPAHRRGLAGIIAFFTVPAMGVTPEIARQHIDEAAQVTAWMETYVAQPFPGAIDETQLPEGSAIYATACASCHGTYDDDLAAPHLLSFPNWEGDVGTDPARARLVTPDTVAAIETAFGDQVDARTTTTYAAPPLTGLWSSAPYFHNGSVPTLWHMLAPDERPLRFMVGGHRLDMDRVGIDLDPPEGYEPWSMPAEVDTSLFGLSASGHTYGADLGEGERRALIEYLKRL